jgi:two-component system chemotaxis response regulator CheY
MKTLIVEDNFVNRLILQKFLNTYGATHIAVNGKEAIEAVLLALNADEPYDLICMDVLMPEMDGMTALRHIRELEVEKGMDPKAGCKIIMTTSVDDTKNIAAAIEDGCDSYMIKPLSMPKLLWELRSFGLVA